MVSDVFTTDIEPTSGPSYLGTSFRTREQGVHLKLCDTAEQEWFDLASTTHTFDTQVVVIVYDATDRDSFAGVSRMIAQVRTQRPDMPMIMVANKVDDVLQQRVSQDEGERLAEELDVFYTETSAKEGRGIERVEDLILDIVWDPSFKPLCLKLPDLVLTLGACSDASGHFLVTCTSMAGNVLATLNLTQPVTLSCLQQTLVERLDLPRTRLKMVLPNGELASCKHSISDCMCFEAMQAAYP
jgi:hypothetical protein